jgi:heparosan-N-sulfate-glucuronate 5-epimerase
MKLHRIMTDIFRYTLPKSSVSFWHTPIKFIHYEFSTLENYYIDFTAKTFYKGPYEQGVPILDYKGEIGKQFNPCAIAQYGLGWYTRYKAGDANAISSFIHAANWLCDNIRIIDEKRGAWYYNFDLDSYSIKAPWCSALAQGQGISLLLRAYLQTGNLKYLKTSEYAMNHMLHPVEQNGLLYTQGSNIYFEEVVSHRLTAILDGMIFSIFGLYDYYFVTQEHSSLLKKSVNTIKNILPQYDLGFWSRADLYNQSPPMISSLFYHNLHIEQLKALFHLSGIELFDFYQKKWGRYQKNSLYRWYAFVKKVLFKIRYY